MIIEILVLIPIVLMVVLFIVLSSYFDPMYAIGISLGVAGAVTIVIGKVGTKMGIFREENKVE